MRALHESNELPFYEVFIAAPLEVCERRDVKGLYRRARSGEIKHFTGLTSAYEAPIRPDLTLHTDRFSIQQCVQQLIRFLAEAVSRFCGFFFAFICRENDLLLRFFRGCARVIRCPYEKSVMFFTSFVHNILNEQLHFV